jgi:8-oxo-dGTP pyrophosphatase MutT (NUDIX family)
VESFLVRLEKRLRERPAKPLQELQAGWREAAVLVPLFLRGDVPHLVFTQRPAALRNHGGQISFPGGGRDPHDASAAQTALRETQEELGISPAQVEVLGTLDESFTSSEYRVVPVVGAIPENLEYLPNATEVEEIIEIPWASLRRPEAHRTELRTFKGRAHEVHVYEYGRYVIWGATARIVWNLFQVAGELSG